MARFKGILTFSSPVLVLVGLLLSACQSQASSGNLSTPPSLTTNVKNYTETPLGVTPTSPLRTTSTRVSPAVEPTSTTPPTPVFFPYYTQSGDTLAVVAQRFGIQPGKVTSPDSLSQHGLLSPGQLLLIPFSTEVVTDGEPTFNSKILLPDSEVIYSPSAIDFDVAEYIIQAGGLLSTYQEYLRSTGWTSAAEIINRVAIENSINPRLLLSLLEYEAHCVFGYPDDTISNDYLMNMRDYRRKGLYLQLGWVASQLSVGYYGWRTGTLTEIQLPDGTLARPAPTLNAGSVALQYFFAASIAAKDDPSLSWEQALYSEQGLPELHTHMFSDPWNRAKAVEPLFPSGLTQPELNLPFEPDRLWSYISGPHTVWESEGAQAALDFAPATANSGCARSNAWVVAVADGPVISSKFGAVIQNLSRGSNSLSAGREHTGWTILYLHVDDRDRVVSGTHLRAGDRIGHPSCEGGRANGTHVHIARKYNGEWIPADGPLPFVLSGWVAHTGSNPYEGTLTKDGQTVIAHPYGSFKTHISIQKDAP